MPSGSISQQPERPDANKRHAEVVQSQMSDEQYAREVLRQMDATLEDILTLTRRYMRLSEQNHHIVGLKSDPTLAQFSVLWIVGRAHLADTIKEIRRLHNEMEQRPRI